ncbi:hypothetical protein KQX54_004287 [Cotesia glomerata]|uniref:Uncharacterized protein n=1 Tax=Cotesia glomerata TaxID=32391 RepID=A0AAV7ICC4_COTGL|nr:hypothetical protein KQX54_004287 [Cotesia glomerata]
MMCIGFGWLVITGKYLFIRTLVVALQEGPLNLRALPGRTCTPVVYKRGITLRENLEALVHKTLLAVLIPSLPLALSYQFPQPGPSPKGSMRTRIR